MSICRLSAARPVGLLLDVDLGRLEIDDDRPCLLEVHPVEAAGEADAALLPAEGPFQESRDRPRLLFPPVEETEGPLPRRLPQLLVLPAEEPSLTQFLPYSSMTSSSLDRPALHPASSDRRGSTREGRGRRRGCGGAGRARA